MKTSTISSLLLVTLMAMIACTIKLSGDKKDLQNEVAYQKKRGEIIEEGYKAAKEGFEFFSDAFIKCEKDGFDLIDQMQNRDRLEIRTLARLKQTTDLLESSARCNLHAVDFHSCFGDFDLKTFLENNRKGKF